VGHRLAAWLARTCLVRKTSIPKRRPQDDPFHCFLAMRQQSHPLRCMEIEEPSLEQVTCTVDTAIHTALYQRSVVGASDRRRSRPRHCCLARTLQIELRQASGPSLGSSLRQAVFECLSPAHPQLSQNALCNSDSRNEGTGTQSDSPERCFLSNGFHCGPRHLLYRQPPFTCTSVYIQHTFDRADLRLRVGA
jgi:hypothetical protein